MENCKAGDKVKAIDIAHIDRGSKVRKKDLVVQEIPLTILLNGTEVATLLCSPEKLDFLIAGYLLSEGFINRDTKLGPIDVNPKGWYAQVTAEGKVTLFDGPARTRLVTLGCGGSLSFYRTIDAPGHELLSSSLRISCHKISEFMKEFQSRSVTFRKTGGVHACALCDENKILCYAEDIGRHNALDKIIGECFLKGLSLQNSVLLTTGRVSSEILIKLLKAKVPVIVSRSAPTSLATELAQKMGITLIGFARGTRMNIYCGESRIDTNDKTPLKT